MAKSILLLIVPLATLGAAESGSVRRIAQAPKSNNPKNEQLANKLVEQHLPELRDVLKSLQKQSPKEYQHALSDLAKASRRLDSLKVRDEVAYELEIKLLQAQTRTDLALAELQLKDSPPARKKYRSAVEERETVKLARAKLEQQRLLERMSKLQQQIDRVTKQIESTEVSETVERVYSTTIRRLSNTQPRSHRKPNSSGPQKESRK